VLRLVVVWLIHTLALLGVAYFMTSVEIQSFGTALLAAGLLGLANVIVRPILVLLTLPVTVLTLGLFILVINGAIFLAIAQLVPGFQITGLGAAILAAILYSIFSWLLAALVLR
jgi:putative membrane protein